MELAGGYDTGDGLLPLGAVHGRHVVVPTGKGFRVLRAEPAP